MSWSLGLRHGDLYLDRGGLGVVTEANKLVQDLRCALLEPRGHDRFHPAYGSLLDGGIDEYGNNAASLIGESDWEYVATQVRAEISRITSLYQAQQVERSKNDRMKYGNSTLSPQELLFEVGSVSISQAQDSMMVYVTLVTGSGTQIPIEIPITNKS